MQKTSKYLFGLSATNGRLKKKSLDMVFQTKSKTKISDHFSEPSKQTSLPNRRNATTFLCSSVIVMTSRSPSSES